MASWTKAITDPLNAASDLAQGLMSLRDITKLGGVVVQLNAQIIAAQRGAFLVGPDLRRPLGVGEMRRVGHVRPRVAFTTGVHFKQ